ncbi:unnamed protein product [Enterobius vermicularis]|uniref:BZIP domain-containing protein n=1 Tax=Enterobius vermicularis TaxID=51028 RepID=A0A0N4VPT6_ENTVE|nr:unnamed protein product [Enterobius vermicularis]
MTAIFVRRCESLLDTTSLGSEGSPASTCEDSWGTDAGCNQFNVISENDSPTFLELENIRNDEGDWLEKWMDLNGVFDPNVEVSCSDIEVSFCPSREVVVRADDCGDISQSSVGISEAGQRKVSVKFQAFQEGVYLPTDLEVPDGRTTIHFVGDEGMKDWNIENVDCKMKPSKVPKVVAVSPVTLKDAKAAGSAKLFTMMERKREQNRSAAVRYREKRREEAKRKKEELRELELRNVALKTEASGLTTEICY